MRQMTLGKESGISKRRLGHIARRCAFVMVTGLLVLGSSCPPSDNGGTDTTGTVANVDPTHKFLVSLNGSDSRLLQFVNADGQTITEFGDRDENGDPTRITALFIQNPDQLATGEGTYLYFDGQDRPDKLVGPDGTTIELLWQSDTSVVVKATSADGSSQVSTDATLTPDQVAKDTAASKATEKSTHETANLTSPDIRQDINPVDAELIVIDINICGSPPTEDAVKSVVVDLEGTEPHQAYVASRTVLGNYVVTIPTVNIQPDNATNNLERFCDKFAPLAVEACFNTDYAQALEDQLCGKLSTVLPQSNFPDPQQVSVSNMCHLGFTVLKSHCTQIKFASTIGISIPNVICGDLKGILPDIISGGTPVIAHAKATIEGLGTVEADQTLDPLALFNAGQVGHLTIGSATPKTLSLKTEPASPGASVSYVATATVACAIGKQVVISVQGTDGFTKQNTVAATAQIQDVTLSVPGGASGVQDTITVKIDGEVSRTTSLIFGANVVSP